MTKDEQLEAKDIILDLLNQHCGEWKHNKQTRANIFKGYDSRCLSANEGALEFCVRMGWIKQEEVIR